jgi:PKD repeat protein
VRQLKQLHVILFLFLFSLPVFAGTTFKATTTLTAETSNNTSTAGSFTAQTNGNLGASNISKVPTRSLLYPGSTAKIYAHFLPWFGFGDHMNVGYISSDTLQIQKQVNDMISRGMNGAVIDWYGRGESSAHFASYDLGTQGFMHESELHPGFNFAIMHDAGALKTCAATLGCDVTQTLIDDLNYANLIYFGSPAYLRSGGRPVVYFFGHEAYAIDWARVGASVAGNPMFIFRNGSGFTKAQTSGAFSWVAPETVSATNLMALSYLDNYYKTAISFPTSYSTGSAYKGFNDTLALWGSNRIVDQQCGQTWLQSVADAGKYYSATKQMLGIQLVTWNDYEEGSEIETGIDNCVSVSATVSGTVVSWSITGQMNTIDHFSVFVSQDGENLMWLADAATSVTSLNLASFNLNSGNYIVFVKAVGKPSLTNKMSAGVQLTVPNLPPSTVLNVTPSSGTGPLTVNATTAGSSDPDGTIASTSINFGDGSAAVSGTSASHIYKATGTYTITASVTDNLGATTNKSATVVVTGSANKPPIAAISATPASAYGPVTVSLSAARSSDPDGTIASVALSFGDGSTASGLAASHTYNTAGVYTVSAKVTDNQGASSTASTTVIVKAPEVIVSSPANNLSVVSSVNVVATGFSGNPVTAMQIYRDSVLIYTIRSANLNTTVALTAGTHTLVVKGWDSAGRSFAKTLTVSASQATGILATTTSLQSASSATVPVTPKVVVSSPANGDQVLSSVHVVAEGFSNHRIMAMQIYRDYKLIYSVHSPNLDTTIGLTAGKHLLAVKGWDSSGQSFMKLLNVTASR